MKGSAPPKNDSVWGVGEWPGTGTMAAVPAALSPELQNPDSPCAPLVCSASLRQSRGWVATNNVAYIDPLRGSLCLQWTPVSPWWTESLMIFTVGCYVGAFPGSGLLGWEPQLRVETPLSSGGTHHSWDPSWSSAMAHGSGVSLLRLSALPTSLNVAASVNPWL